MGLRFTKHIKLSKHIRFNISKSGIGISGGIKGARISYNPKTGIRRSVGLPGTGIYYSDQHKLFKNNKKVNLPNRITSIENHNLKKIDIASLKYCKNCNQNVKLKKKFSTSRFIFSCAITFLGWFFGGVIYLFYWVFVKKKVCPICNSTNFEHAHIKAATENMGQNAIKSVIDPRKLQAVIKPIEEPVITMSRKVKIKLAGVTFNGVQENLKSMVNDKKQISELYGGFSNKEILEMYSEEDKIYEVTISGITEIQLIPEPTNEFDSNAIKVVHEKNGNIGYIPAIDCKRVKKILDDGYSLEWQLTGGKYKCIKYDYEKAKDVVRINNNTYGILIVLMKD